MAKTDAPLSVTSAPQPKPVTRRRWLRYTLVALGGLVVVAAGAAVTFRTIAARRLAKQPDAHRVDVAIPWDANSADALVRGQHLVDARYGCTNCHGADFGGGTMIDDGAMGRFMGPNLTTGKGSVTVGYSASDWDRIVRHGIKKDGSLSVMPSDDFRQMADQELSDIVYYIRSKPPVDRQEPPVSLGPVGTILVATSGYPLSGETIDHHAEHAKLPPGEDSTALGKHLANVCSGCHGSNLSGGHAPGTPPNWPEASNLTPDTTGLADYSKADFIQVMRTGTKKSGEAVKDPMSTMVPTTAKMTDKEVAALWDYLRGLPAVKKGVR